jgi:hypothetical protein
MAFRSCCKNQVQLSFVSYSKKPKVTGNIQLWPSMMVAEGKWPFHHPFKAVESILKYGLQPSRKASRQGPKAQKNLLNISWPSSSCMSISFTESGITSNTVSFHLNSSQKLSSQLPYIWARAFSFPFHTIS